MNENQHSIDTNGRGEGMSTSGWEDAGQYVSTEQAFSRDVSNDDNEHSKSTGDNSKLESEPMDIDDIQRALFESENDEQLKNFIADRLKTLEAASEHGQEIGLKFGPSSSEKESLNSVAHGFLPSDMRIHYDVGGTRNIVSSYLVGSSDYMYDFVNYAREHRARGGRKLLSTVNQFMVHYFGGDNKEPVDENTRGDVLLASAIEDRDGDGDDAFWDAVESRTLGDLKGKNAAMCTEYAAMAQNILTFLGYDSVMCHGSVAIHGVEQPVSTGHAFNITKNKKGESIILDFAMPALVYGDNGKVLTRIPFEAKVGAANLNDGVAAYDYHCVGIPPRPVRTNGVREYRVGHSIRDASH